MLLHIPKDLRLRLGKKYLKLARLLPQFGGGFIRSLQDVTAHHKELAENAYKGSRPPAQVQLGLPYFQLIEMFNLEDFDRLRDGVFRLLPGLKDDFLYKLSTDALTKQAESIQGGGSGFLGYLLRDKKEGWIGRPYRVIAELPAQVDFIKVEYNKILPSVFLITLDVNLTEDATQRLLSLQDQRYEPAILFRSILPWRAIRGGWSERSSESEMRQAILGWLQNLRAGVEECIRPYLSGYFTLHFPDADARLPTVEVYTLKGAPEETSAFSTWTQGVRDWLESLGFRFIFDVYTDERLVFTVPESEEPKGRSAYRLIALWDTYLKSISAAGFGGDERRAIAHSTTYVLRALGSLIVLSEFLNTVQANIAKLRKITFGAMKRRRFLSGYMKLLSTIQRESILLDRISMEFKQQRSWLAHDALEIGELREFIPAGQTSEPSNFAANVLTGLEKRMQRLREQMEHVEQSFSRFLAVQNMKALYRLQWFVLGLSIVATLAALVSAIASWPNIRQFLQDIFGLRF